MKPNTWTRQVRIRSAKARDEHMSEGSSRVQFFARRVSYNLLYPLHSMDQSLSQWLMGFATGGALSVAVHLALFPNGRAEGISFLMIESMLS